ncbi:hypothetical protein ASB57_05905 [Bordetella sp. N]|nr:hypothetical protein ASB57_05905 [Bordetella sp. N]
MKPTLAQHLPYVSPQPPSFSSFDGPRRLISGTIQVAAAAMKKAHDEGAAGPFLLFDDGTGRKVDIDTRGDTAQVMARLAEHPVVVALAAAAAAADQEAAFAPAPPPRGRGRPKLGVVAREVTLLPRHWEWLAAQAGGASITLRRLVDEARRSGREKIRVRQAREAAYYFMQTMAGDLSGFEAAARALFAGDRATFVTAASPWPIDIRDHALRLGFDAIADAVVDNRVVDDRVVEDR